ncbi:MAG TPA: efflux RND transporter periplasmic adaptor subunit [Opitutaceae bacterium]|jgi:RND family efflux transporter MFP subunit|nr:efflux RND transporter periplasmic adaptor subunit [Opitutaceae bacterium]
MLRTGTPSRLLALAAALLLAPVLARADNKAEGLVLPFQQVSVSCRIAGLIESISVKEGDNVAEGQVLAQLYRAEEELEALRTAALVKVKTFDAEGTEQLAEKNMARKDEAVEKGGERDIAVLQARLAQVALERKLIKSPLSGVLVSRKKEPGEWVEPGAVVFEVVSFDQVYVQILLTSEQAQPLKLGQTMKVELPQLDSGATVSGKVDFIDPRVDAASGYQRVKILLSNPGRRILPGTRALVVLP